MAMVVSLFLLSPILIEAKEPETHVIAAVIIREAGGEGKMGMQAVANVIQNRMRGKTAYQVVTAPKQFSCYNNYVNREEDFVALAAGHSRFEHALELAKQIQTKSVPDITRGSTHYHTIHVRPYWADKFPFTVKIGNHLFYRGT